MGYESWTWGLSGGGIPTGLANQLRTAGHSVTIIESPDEEQFISLLSNNDIVYTVGHGPDAVLIGETNLTDKLGNPFSAIKLGGIIKHPNDNPVKGALSGLEEYPPAEWITANELSGRVNNPNLEFVGGVCLLGRTNRFSNSIGSKHFIGSPYKIAGPQLRHLMEFVVDRANGLSTENSFQRLSQKDNVYVHNPKNSTF
ncbi:MAG: hypothetical protein WDA68_09145 [Phycisphaerae bacterium]